MDRLCKELKDIVIDITEKNTDNAILASFVVGGKLTSLWYDFISLGTSMEVTITIIIGTNMLLCVTVYSKITVWFEFHKFHN